MGDSILAYLAIFTLFFFFPSSTNAAYNVVNFGAKPNGRTDSTKAFLSAWASACNSIKPAVVYVPTGRYLINQIAFEGPCKNSRMEIWIHGTLLAPHNYEVVGKVGSWIMFHSISGLSIYGGVVNARASQFWACRDAHRNCPQGARSIAFNYVRNVVVDGLTSINSQTSHMAISGCDNMVIRRFTIKAPQHSPNTDGIDIQDSTGITITDSNIKTGDDCVAIGPGSKNISVQRVTCGPGHGISIGSLGKQYYEEGVEDVRVSDVVFIGTENGVRIKTWARPSNGFVRNVIYQNIIMHNVQNPIVIDQTYCPGGHNCPNQESTIEISGVTYQNIRGTSATEVAIEFNCSPRRWCERITMKDIKLTHKINPASSTCLNVVGTASGLILPGSCL